MYVTTKKGFEEDMLRLVEENPSTSTRKVAQTLHTSQNAMWQVVHDQQLHPSAKSPRITGGGLHMRSTVCGVVFTTMHTTATILELGAIHRRMHVYHQWNFKPA